MPQMAPLNWLTLFTCFNIILLVCLTKIWFTAPIFNKPNLVMSIIKNKSNNLFWKW